MAAARLGADVLEPGITKLAEKHRSIGDIRGIGGLLTVELVRKRLSKEPLLPVGATGEADAPMTAFARACLAGDVLRQLDDHPLRAADVPEPMTVVVALHLADELRAAGSQPSDGVDIVYCECDMADA